MILFVIRSALLVLALVAFLGFRLGVAVTITLSSDAAQQAGGDLELYVSALEQRLRP